MFIKRVGRSTRRVGCFEEISYSWLMMGSGGWVKAGLFFSVLDILFHLTLGFLDRNSAVHSVIASSTLMQISSVVMMRILRAGNIREWEYSQVSQSWLLSSIRTSLSD